MSGADCSGRGDSGIACSGAVRTAAWTDSREFSRAAGGCLPREAAHSFHECESVGSIFTAVIPDPLRSRVAGAFQAVNYGTRPAAALLGGVLCTMIGLRPALWVATAGGVLGFLVLLPSPMPAFKMPSG
jgi:hypothetical protein